MARRRGRHVPWTTTGALAMAIVVAACGDSTGGPGPIAGCSDDLLAATVANGNVTTSIVAAPVAAAAPGTTDARIAGTFARSLDGPSTGYEQSFLGSLSVFDARELDAAGRPVAELVLILPSRVDGVVGETREIVPVSLADLRDPSFRPAGPIVVYGEEYRADLKDYARWFVGREGCIAVLEATAGRVGRAALRVAITGRWENIAGDSIGHGALDGALEAPLVRFLSADGTHVTDTLEGELSRGGGEPTNGSRVGATQVLAPDQTRLVVLGEIPGDSIREIRLVLSGVPRLPAEIAIGEATLAEALAGRGAGPLATVRIIVPENGLAVATELWRSIGGAVTLTNVVQNGPLALYGWVTGRYEFRAVAHDLTQPGHPETGDTLLATGAFEARLRVLPPADTLADTVSVPVAAAAR